MGRKITRIIIHHSASSRDTTTVAQIEGWHLKEGYTGIGYHKIITGDGTAHQGRADEAIGAHAYGSNHDSLGICVTGNFDKEHPSAAQRKTLVQTLAVLCRRHGIPPERIIGHRDTIATACPGKNLYADLPAIRREVAGYLPK